MVEDLSNIISKYLVSVHAAAEDDREIIAFGLFHILSSALQIFILIISALILNVLPQIMIFTFCFGSLKRYAGGAHASRHWICLWGFTALAYVGYLLSEITPIIVMPYVSVVVSAVALILVLLKAPVAHPNNPKPAIKLKKLRKIAVSVILVQFAVISVGSLLAPEWLHLYFLCGSLGGFSAGITLILPMPS